MKRSAIWACSAGAIFALGATASALAQSDRPDSTMQVIDDTRDVKRVVDSLATPEPERARRDSPKKTDADAAAADRDPAARSARAERRRELIDRKTEADRDERSEGELEDNDLPEDAVVDD